MLSASGLVDVRSTAGAVSLDAFDELSLTANADVDIVSATGSFSVNGFSSSSVIVNSSSAGDDLILEVSGATDSSVRLLSSGTSTDAVSVSATSGGVSISGSNNVDIFGDIAIHGDLYVTS